MKTLRLGLRKKFLLDTIKLPFRMNHTHENGEKDGFDYLLKNQQEIFTHYKQYLEADAFDSKKRRKNQIIREQTMQIYIEQKHLYPLFQRYLQNDRIIELLLTDHKCILEIMNTLDKYEPVTCSRIFNRLLKQLMELIEEHFKDEKAIMDDLRKKMSKEEIQNLEDLLFRARLEAPEKPYQRKSKYIKNRLLNM